MVNFKCYYCGCNSYEILANKENIRFNCYGYDKFVLKCKQCELVQLFPQWTEEELNILYEKYSQKQDFIGQKKKKEIRKWIMKYLPRHMSSSVLEIGCGCGDTIKWLRSKGIAAIGVDRDKTIQDVKNGVYCYDFNKYSNTPGWQHSFICAFQVLEHVNPIEFINNILNLLQNYRGEKKFVMEIPNIEEPLLTIYKNKNYNKFYWYLYHLFFYSPKTISNILKLFPIKFKIVRKQKYGLFNHIMWMIKGKPSNINFHIPILDNIYKFFLTKILKKSDTMIVICENE